MCKEEWTPTYEKSQRFFNHLCFDPNGKVQVNQHSFDTEQERRDFAYRHLIARTRRVKRGDWHCWEADETMPGIQVVNGYRRMRYGGSKKLCHVFTWEYYNPGVKKPRGYDVSHICGNPACCRPGHLRLENRRYQRTRDSCYYEICKHDPRCKKTKEFCVYRRH